MRTITKARKIEVIEKMIKHLEEARQYNCSYFMCNDIGWIDDSLKLSDLGIYKRDNRHCKGGYAWYPNNGYDDRLGHLYLALFKLNGYNE